MVGVTGSIPVAPTIHIPDLDHHQRDNFKSFLFRLLSRNEMIIPSGWRRNR
jgi:hypothetical protein